MAILFGWGNFNRAPKIEETAQCFALFCVGLFAWGGQALVARGFYALGDTKTPTIYGSILTLLYIALCAALKHFDFGVAGLALATSIGAAGQFVGLLVLLESRLKGPRFDAPLGLDRIAGTIVRTFVACFLMGVARTSRAPTGAPVGRGRQSRTTAPSVVDGRHRRVCLRVGGQSVRDSRMALAAR